MKLKIIIKAFTYINAINIDDNESIYVDNWSYELNTKRFHIYLLKNNTIIHRDTSRKLK